MKRNLGVVQGLMITTSFVLVNVLVSVLALGATGCGSAESSTPPSSAVEPGLPASGPVLSEQVAVDQIAVFQGVKVTIVKEGEVVPSASMNAPLIANRPAYVRVFAKALGRARPNVEAVLRVKRAGKADVTYKDVPKPVAPDLDDELLENTFNFTIPAEEMTADAALSVTLRAIPAPGVQEVEPLTFPADGTVVALGAKTASRTLKLMFVPVAYEAVEGKSVTPDLGDLAALKTALYKMYPVANVEISVRDPFRWSSIVRPDGRGWDELLSGVMQLRRADKAERDVYYVGVLTPAPTLEQFCDNTGCVMGIAPQADELSVGLRAALVLGYQNRSAGGTLAQELAHAMGRGHAPCGGPADIDPDYPYGSGGIGVWGYDIVDKKLINPVNRYRDFMSYCGPVWVSDYTFKGLYERMEILTEQQRAIDAENNGVSTKLPARPQAMSSFRIARDGSVTAGPPIDVLPGTPSGTRAQVAYESADGTVLATGTGRVHAVSGTGSKIVVAPLAPPGAIKARLTGFGVTALSPARVLSR